MFTDEEELCIGRTVPGASPIPNLDYLDDEIWDFWTDRI